MDINLTPRQSPLNIGDFIKYVEKDTILTAMERGKTCDYNFGVVVDVLKGADGQSIAEIASFSTSRPSKYSINNTLLSNPSQDNLVYSVIRQEEFIVYLQMLIDQVIIKSNEFNLKKMEEINSNIADCEMMLKNMIIEYNSVPKLIENNFLLEVTKHVNYSSKPSYSKNLIYITKTMDAQYYDYICMFLNISDNSINTFHNLTGDLESLSTTIAAEQSYVTQILNNTLKNLHNDLVKIEEDVKAMEVSINNLINRIPPQASQARDYLIDQIKQIKTEKL